MCRGRGMRYSILVSLLIAAASAQADHRYFEDTDIPRRVFWGDTHLHTSNSVDASTRGATLGVADAYRFALGEAVTASSGQIAKLSRPLDFLVVADHAESLGVGREIREGNPDLIADPTVKRWHEALEEGRGALVLRELRELNSAGKAPPVMRDRKIMGGIMRRTWQDYIDTADAFNQPGRFTALIGYEWTAVRTGDNYHRVVVLADGRDVAGRVMPFSSRVSKDPAQLWAWMQNYETEIGGRTLAIPHNPNQSNGNAFAFADFEGRRITADYGQMRRRFEPLIEVTQIKGDSESHPFLSPTDEFADFETWDEGNALLNVKKEPGMLAGEYARSALKRGLLLERETGVNPFSFGMIGSSDSHTSLATVEENNFFGKHPGVEPGAERAMRRAGNPQRLDPWRYQSAGYAAVWAKENTRSAIFEAMQRKEVYATTGSRMTVSMFAGWDFTEADADTPDLRALGYRKGIPMGGQLASPEGRRPSLLISAMKDPLGANLDRVQVVKGWLDDEGGAQEKVYDVVWSGAREITNGRLAPVGNTVDVATATWTNSIGAVQLTTVWEDDNFDAEQPAFYYVRVLEIPTPRWTTYDAVRFNLELPDDVPRTVQERAYTSPVWYTPSF